MSYMNTIPEWQNEGTEPSEELQTSGFQGGYKPPAGIFNWFWHKVTACINELQTRLEEMSAADSIIINDTLVTASWVDNNYTWKNNNIVSANQIVELIPRQNITAEQLESLQTANIVGTSQATGSITMTAFGEIPTIDIPVTFIIRGDA